MSSLCVYLEGGALKRASRTGEFRRNLGKCRPACWLMHPAGCHDLVEQAVGVPDRRVDRRPLLIEGDTANDARQGDTRPRPPAVQQLPQHDGVRVDVTCAGELVAAPRVSIRRSLGYEQQQQQRRRRRR